MKRVTFVAVLVAVLVVSATALAASTTYSGSVSSGVIKFKLQKGSHGTKLLRKLVVDTVPIKCNAGSNTVGAIDKLDSLPVKKDGTFDVKLRATEHQYDAKVVWKGTLHGPAANGTFHLSGSKVPLGDGTVGKNCDTGVLKWSATS